MLRRPGGQCQRSEECRSAQCLGTSLCDGIGFLLLIASRRPPQTQGRITYTPGSEMAANGRGSLGSTSIEPKIHRSSCDHNIIQLVPETNCMKGTKHVKMAYFFGIVAARSNPVVGETLSWY